MAIAAPFGNCGMCGKHKKLVKTHIVPRKLYAPIKGAAQSFVLADINGKRLEFSQSGIWEYLLCGECESRFSPWDSHAEKVLLAPWIPSQYVRIGKSDAYLLTGVDYNKFKLFCISVLWKASLAKHEAFARVVNGPWTNRFKKMMLSSNPGRPEKYAVILYKFHSADAATVFDFGTATLESFTGHVMYMAGYRIHIMTDGRNLAEKYRSPILRPSKDLPVTLMDYIASEERKWALDIRSKYEFPKRSK